jgi:co-chaperonin GroES (HSP10)
MKPLRDRIIVRPDKQRENMTRAGIVVMARSGIHTSNEQLGLQGTVMWVGPEVDRDQLKPGDRVLFGEFNYPELWDGPEKLYCMQDKDICGVIDG